MLYLPHLKNNLRANGDILFLTDLLVLFCQKVEQARATAGMLFSGRNSYSVQVTVTRASYVGRKRSLPRVRASVRDFGFCHLSNYSVHVTIINH